MTTTSDTPAHKPDAKTGKDKLDHISTGGHLGGTTFGQTEGEAKSKDRPSPKDEARPEEDSSQ